MKLQLAFEPRLGSAGMPLVVPLLRLSMARSSLSLRGTSLLRLKPGRLV